MSEEIDYRIAIEPLNERLCVSVGGKIVADSKNVTVMHETHLPSHPYIPKSDVGSGILEPSPLRTFCPFKGTAHYWNLRLPGGLIENGAWSYEAPLEEASSIGGCVAFDPKHIDHLPLGCALPPTADAPFGGNPLIDWIMRKAGSCQTPSELTEQFAEHLIAIGMPIWRINVGMRTLHPLLVARQFTWRRGVDGIVQTEAPPELLQEPSYLNSPIMHVRSGLGGVRQRLDVPNPEFSYPIMDDLRADGGTDYVAMPLTFSDGQINTVTMATDHPDGFSTDHLGQVFEALTALGRFYEVLTLRHNTTALFDAYLGERTRQQILAGSTHRGDGENIRAAIIFCDLRDSTQLADTLSLDEYLGLLNGFFEHAAEPILNRGGEVLKFIGDAVLAIFPVEDDEHVSAACAKARDAAEEIVAHMPRIATGDGRPSLRCAIGLHVGDVMYGNVGAPERLDFTVTGTAVNIAARLSSQCKILDQPLLISEDVARHVPDNLASQGTQALRHVSNDLEVFAVG
jgi:adenylate cyclase